MQIKLNQDQIKGIKNAFDALAEICATSEDCSDEARYQKSVRINDILDTMESLLCMGRFNLLHKLFQTVFVQEHYTFCAEDIEQIKLLSDSISDIIHSGYVRTRMVDGDNKKEDLIPLDAIKKVLDIHILVPLNFEVKIGYKELKLPSAATAPAK